MTQNYGFLGYRYVLGRLGLFACSRFTLFMVLFTSIGVLGLAAGGLIWIMFFPKDGYWYLVMFPVGIVPASVFGIMSVMGARKYRKLLPEYWIDMRRKYLKKYPELAQILHDGDLITDAEVERLKNLRDNYIQLKSLFECKLEKEKQLAEQAKKLREDIEETSAKLRKEEKALRFHNG